MTFTAVEWIVIIFAALGLIKLLVISISRKRWIPVIDEVYRHPRFFTLIFAILAIVTGYYVLREISFVQLVAAMAVTWSLSALAFLHYAKEMRNIAKKSLSVPINGWLWFYIIIWAVIFIWALKLIFA